MSRPASPTPTAAVGEWYGGRRRRCSSWPTARSSRARPSARRPPKAVATGELVFNTVLSGYQEVVTDPSYAGQVIAFTYPHIGNYGVTPDDDEAPPPVVPGRGRSRARRPALVLAGHRRRSRTSSSATASPASRASTPGASPGTCARTAPWAVPSAPRRSPSCAAAAAAEPGTTGRDLVTGVSPRRPYEPGLGPASGRRLRLRGEADHAAQLGPSWPRSRSCPPRFPAAEALALEPDGVFLSNGPGDPAALGTRSASSRELLGRVPVFGICLGHQLLGRAALGARTFKLPFGHHGGNHPGAAARHRPGGDHEPEPQLRRRRRRCRPGTRRPPRSPT